jgi:hypothetical protein
MTTVVAMPSQSDVHPLSAGAYLLTVLALCIGAGAGIGAALGDVGIGVGVGALVGVPAGIAAVVLRYRKTG